jgi:hypothetical protein
LSRAASVKGCFCEGLLDRLSAPVTRAVRVPEVHNLPLEDGAATKPRLVCEALVAGKLERLRTLHKVDLDKGAGPGEKDPQVGCSRRGIPVPRFAPLAPGLKAAGHKLDSSSACFGLGMRGGLGACLEVRL